MRSFLLKKTQPNQPNQKKDEEYSDFSSWKKCGSAWIFPWSFIILVLVFLGWWWWWYRFYLSSIFVWSLNEFSRLCCISLVQWNRRLDTASRCCSSFRFHNHNFSCHLGGVRGMPEHFGRRLQLIYIDTIWSSSWWHLWWGSANSWALLCPLPSPMIMRCREAHGWYF